jgi:Phage gp6-like head-tail connector protein
MAIIDGLTTLANVKQRLNIASADTSRDALLEALINDASALIISKLKRDLKRITHTSEKHASVPSSYLLLNARPIQSVSSVILSGTALASGSDSGYYLSGEDQLAGRLYRPIGWLGSMLVRGVTLDPYEGYRDISVTYVSGYYLPADVGYVQGASHSLPNNYTQACTQVVRAMFLQTTNSDLQNKEIGEILANYGVSTEYYL